jgi:hypothetical protein
MAAAAAGSSTEAGVRNSKTGPTAQTLEEAKTKSKKRQLAVHWAIPLPAGFDALFIRGSQSRSLLFCEPQET